jgi:hypothetical protein
MYSLKSATRRAALLLFEVITAHYFAFVMRSPFISISRSETFAFRRRAFSIRSFFVMLIVHEAFELTASGRQRSCSFQSAKCKAFQSASAALKPTAFQTVVV